jgi:uncharacterized nucleotidyltransferase DUF6036
MREKVTAARLQEFMKRLGETAVEPARIFLVGGASAVLLGWRESTIDIDLKVVAETDDVLRSVPELKERLQVNVELASPDDFIPELPGWQDRSRFIQQNGNLTFLHYDFYAQALAKIERGHQTDLQDVHHMIQSALVDPTRLLELFSEVEEDMYRYPAIDGKKFRAAVERIVREAKDD